MKIPEPYITTRNMPQKLKHIPYAAARKNLEFHHLKDSTITLKGTVDDMVQRLKKFLKQRCERMRDLCTLDRRARLMLAESLAGRWISS